MSLTFAINKHIFDNLGVTSPLPNSLLSPKFQLPSLFFEEDDQQVEYKFYGAKINQSDLMVLICFSSLDYFSIIYHDKIRYGLFLNSTDKLSLFGVSGQLETTDLLWSPGNTYLHGSCLTGMESLKDYPITWEPLTQTNDFKDNMLKFIAYCDAQLEIDYEG